MSLSSFLHPVNNENAKVNVSKRFVDENGNIEKWEIKPISEAETEKIREMIRAKNGGKEQYMYELCAKCVVYPDLKAAELQDAYGVLSEAELLKTMLLPGEYTRLVTAVSKINDYDVNFDKAVEEAKNL